MSRTTSAWSTVPIVAVALALSALLVPTRGLAQVRSFPRIDEASRDPEFLRFRTRLRDIVAARDAASLQAIVASDVRWSFGDHGGIEGALSEWQLDSPKSSFWRELDRVLGLGGQFRDGSTFEAPYVFAAFPDDLSAFEYAAIIADGVNVRAGPNAQSARIATIGRSVVAWSPFSSSIEANAGWDSIRLVDGRAGFVASQYVRSPIGYRAIFERRDGHWLLTAFVAGD